MTKIQDKLIALAGVVNSYEKLLGVENIAGC